MPDGTTAGPVSSVLAGIDTATVEPLRPVTVNDGALVVPEQVSVAPQVAAPVAAAIVTVEVPVMPAFGAIWPKSRTESPVTATMRSVLRISAWTWASSKVAAEALEAKPTAARARPAAVVRRTDFMLCVPLPSVNLLRDPFARLTGSLPADWANRAAPIQTWSVNLVNGCAFFL